MNNFFTRINVFFFLVYCLILPPVSWASLLPEQEDYEPLNYISQFIISADEASSLLQPYWLHGEKGKLAKMIGVSPQPLTVLMNEKKANKALRMFNISLVEKQDFWNLFPPLRKAQIILGQLIRNTSEEDVAKQLEIELNQLQSFQSIPEDKNILKKLSKVTEKNWTNKPTLPQHPLFIVTTDRLPATYDHRAVAGVIINANSVEASCYIDDKWEALHGSSGEGSGQIPPRSTVLHEKQKKHLAQFKTAFKELKPADPKVSLQKVTELMGGLSIQSSPSPGIGKIYVESPQKKKELQEHPHMNQEIDRRFFTEGTTSPNYLSKTGADITETFAHCRPTTSTFDGKRQYPMASYRYQHKLSTGHILRFDRGHGCDHADTLEHGGTLSTYDPDNYVPQNRYYNEYIRNPLVARIRNAGGEYKEISLYHHTPYKIDHQRIPEAFIFIELYKGIAQFAYFFPNFIAYEALDFERKFKSMYLNFLELFRVDALIEYFFNPFVQADNPIPHMEQRNKATIFSERTYLDITALFNNMTEHAFPPRARSALIRSIMNQNINTAAILDFVGLTSIETAINHYANNRIYWELDDRLQEDRKKAFDTHFPKLSDPVKQAFELTKTQFPEEYKNQKSFREQIIRAFGSLVTIMGNSDQKVMRDIIGGYSIKNIDLAKKYLQFAFSKIDAGTYNDRDLRGIQRILTHIPELENLEKFNALDKLYKDKKNIQRKIEGEMMIFTSPSSVLGINSFVFFKDNVLINKLNAGIEAIRLGNLKAETLFEMLLILEADPQAQWIISFKQVCDSLASMELMETTFTEKKQIADFFWILHFQKELDEWVQKINAHFEEEPSQENATLFASWLREGSGGLEKNETFAQEVEEAAREHARVEELWYGPLFKNASDSMVSEIAS